MGTLGRRKILFLMLISPKLLSLFLAPTVASLHMYCILKSLVCIPDSWGGREQKWKLMFYKGKSLLEIYENQYLGVLFPKNLLDDFCSYFEGSA
eukprot:snap_masked-scaffold_48-processed-gene-1.98-mRNA-1 protein AED:1.00 eAED:1.00 QI:0/0/0/0/1/1/3/0/93